MQGKAQHVEWNGLKRDQVLKTKEVCQIEQLWQASKESIFSTHKRNMQELGTITYRPNFQIIDIRQWTDFLETLL